MITLIIWMITIIAAAFVAIVMMLCKNKGNIKIKIIMRRGLLQIRKKGISK